MIKAAQKADRIDKGLAQRIRENVVSYEPGNCEIVTVGGICSMIEDAVMGNQERVSFQKLINWIARNCGNFSQEFRDAYRRSLNHFKRVFDEANRVKAYEEKMRKVIEIDGRT
jgi:hypothetical protein